MVIRRHSATDQPRITRLLRPYPFYVSDATFPDRSSLVQLPTGTVLRLEPALRASFAQSVEGLWRHPVGGTSVTGSEASG